MARPFQTQFRPELVDASVYLAPNATVLGEVQIGPHSSVWFQAVVRGDTERVQIGAATNIQDGSVLHADPGFPCILGDRVTVGHAAIVHGAIVEDDVIVGMRAVILNGARIGRGSVIGAGALVTEGCQIEPNSLVFGMPGKVVRPTSAEQRERIAQTAEHYVQAARAFAQTGGVARSRLGPTTQPADE